MVPTSSSGYLSPSAYDLRNQVCMIPCGDFLNGIPLKWSDEQLKYYTGYILNGQPIDSMFKGFIFNGYQARESHSIHPLFIGFAEPSDMTDWLSWIDALFAPEANLHALHRLSGNDKMDVWISFPYPHPFQRSFGVVQGRNLDFESDIDRLTAIQWWLDQLLDRWREHSHLHDKLELRGFLWQREVIDGDDEMLVKWINAAIHAKKLLSMWLPNYGSGGLIDWQVLGFHVTALHSNYSGNSSFDAGWINNACLFAKYFKTGIQVTWGKGLMYNDTHHLDYFNRGLEDQNSYMNESFLVYQFQNQTLESIYRNDLAGYIQLYLFVKGLYQKINYPGISY
ncbi:MULTISPECIES: DUF4855 domain-containing protein [unclassified Paenibacillus]|uniref:DUF4855 domain-containing protein n=1 Tax=unclassified Paenibacillus TaxID=185978 RepID=UPI0019160118|nr:DUF4855 domain-containing protein [Paenibacillus sp. EPM92]